jgi:mannosyltransferase OCH1-like enzyme
MAHCRRAGSSQIIDSSSGAAGGGSAAAAREALAAAATLQQPAALQQQQQQPDLQQAEQQQQKQTQQAQVGRHLRPPELDAPADSGMLGLQAARAAAAADAPAPVVQPGVIPKILHRIYIADPNDPKRHNFTMPLAHRQWIETCQLHHSPRAGWRYMYWDYAGAQALIANHFPWFLPFYEANMTKAIEKSDVVRYAILHRVGGVYLDSDIECWREAYDMLEGFDFVAQGTHAAEGTTNAAIAARPGLDVFVKALQLVQTRDIDTTKEMIKVHAASGCQTRRNLRVY